MLKSAYMSNNIDKYFGIQYLDSIAELTLNYQILLENETYSHKEDLLKLIDEIENNTAIHVLIIRNDHPDFSMDKYREKWNSFYGGIHWESNILRVFRTFDELFLKIKSLKKTVMSVNVKPINAAIFNFSMAADLRIISKYFCVDNKNECMVNIPKGGAIYNVSKISFRNPIKLLFLFDEIKADTLYKRQLVDKVYDDNINEKVKAIANRLSSFDYIEFESVKILEHNKANDFERALQQENEFLLSCIRTRINQDK